MTETAGYSQELENYEVLDEFEVEEHTMEECGIFGVCLRPQSNFIGDDFFEGANATRHRGPNGFGVFVSRHSRNDELIHTDTHQHVLKEGVRSLWNEGISYALSHSRYGTSGDFSEKNLQPIDFTLKNGTRIRLSHNGNLVGLNKFQDGYSDTFRFGELMSELDGETDDDIILQAIDKAQGAFSFVIHARNVNGSERLYATRDKNGIRPLVLGETDAGDISIASETIVLQKAGIGNILREVHRGEVIAIEKDENGIPFIRNIREGERGFGRHCSFEFAYFQRPESLIPIDGLPVGIWPSIAQYRSKLGEIMVQGLSRDRDFRSIERIVAIPDSGIMFAEGISNESGVPRKVVFIRDHNSPNGQKRSFLESSDKSEIPNIVSHKLTLVGPLASLKDKHLGLVDDSLVRGNSSERVIASLVKNGIDPQNISLILGYPEVMYGCHLGTSIEADDLLAKKNNGDSKKIAEALGIKSVHFVSKVMMVDALIESIKDNCPEWETIDEVGKVLEELHQQKIFCFGCHDGEYPVQNIIPIAGIPINN